MKTSPSSVPPTVARTISENSWSKQLSLLADQASKKTEADQIHLSVEPVPEAVCLDKEPRFYWVVKQYGFCWHYPFQFCQEEILLLLSHLQSLDWSLDTSSGVPTGIKFLHKQVEHLIDRLLPNMQLQEQRRGAA